MPGHVFHPGHAELHGVTVVVETGSSRTYVGRFDTEDQHGVHLLDVAVHDSATSSVPKQEYIRNSARFGIRSEYKHLLVSAGEIAQITRLGEVL